MQRKTSHNSGQPWCAKLCLVALAIAFIAPAVLAQQSDKEAHELQFQDANPDEVLEEQVIIATADSSSSIEETGFNVDVITLDEHYNSSVDINQILNASAGIIIRRNGGIGGNFDLTLNGLSGDQVRYFFDGVPMENFGSALTFNNYPANLIRNIEVYKGVVPITLGSDALAGAINVISPDLDENFTDLSYSFGSYNTHIAAAIIQRSNDSGHFFRFTSFLNHSDNDYTMQDIVKHDDLGNPEGTHDVKRFHDEYSSAMASVKAGVINQDWADEFSATLTYAGNQREFQHLEQSINKVFGVLHGDNESLLISSRYKKMWQAFSMDAYLMAGEIKEGYNDTASRKYDWTGNYTDTDSSQGEYGKKSIFHQKDEVIRASLYGDYSISDTQLIAANLSSSHLIRSGEDEVAAPITVPFRHPNTITKHILGLDYQQRFFDEDWVSNIFIKLYDYNADMDIDVEEISGPVRIVKDVQLNETGYGLTSRYNLTENLYFKFSYEKAYRMPEPDEILGDGRYYAANPDLSHEKSDNINLGLDWQHHSHNAYINLHGNLFVRDTEDYIKTDVNNLIVIKHSNIGQVNIQGIEAAISSIIEDTYVIDFNITYQDITDQTPVDDDGDVNLNQGNRLPNIPYLFANFRTGVQFYTHGQNQLSLFWQSQYVHEYFLYWEGLGDRRDKNKIPTQLLHNIEVSYSMAAGQYNLSLNMENIFDEAAYDNLNIQKQGRGYYLKFRYFLD